LVVTIYCPGIGILELSVLLGCWLCITTSSISTEKCNAHSTGIHTSTAVAQHITCNSYEYVELYLHNKAAFFVHCDINCYKDNDIT
jgi:hypothetical protein